MVARRRLRYLHAAKRLEDLMVPPGNQLEALKGDRRGQHSIRINRQTQTRSLHRSGKDRFPFFHDDQNSLCVRRLDIFAATPYII